MAHPGLALVLRDGYVLDGVGDSPVAREVWIAGGRIIEPHTEPLGEARSLGGRVVAPGLIDAHVHLCFDAGPDPLAAYLAATPEERLQRMRSNAARTLEAGVTTVRDLGAPTALILQLRDEIARGAIPGPRLLASGAPITAPDGHLHELGGGVRGAHALRDLVQAQHAAGTDLIKVMATGGGLSPQTDPRACQFSDDEIQTAVRTAHAAGLRVACHAHADAGVRQAVIAGADSVEHGSYATRATLEAMRSAGTALVPTLLPAVEALEQPLARERRRAIVDRFDSRRGVVRDAIEVGVKIAAGTDAGVAFTAHGRVAGELQALAECGVPPLQLLAAATRDAAEVLGEPGLGTLTPGAWADLVVLEGNPLDDLSTLAAPWAVMRAGQWVYPPNRGSR